MSIQGWFVGSALTLLTASFPASDGRGSHQRYACFLFLALSDLLLATALNFTSMLQGQHPSTLGFAAG